jgi:hypothetical protein
MRPTAKPSRTARQRAEEDAIRTLAEVAQRMGIDAPALPLQPVPKTAERSLPPWARQARKHRSEKEAKKPQ